MVFSKNKFLQLKLKCQGSKNTFELIQRTNEFSSLVIITHESIENFLMIISQF